jgi:orotate phosphoribosyltransferase
VEGDNEDFSGLTFWQLHRLLEIAGEMNQRLRKLMPELREDVFTALGSEAGCEILPRIGGGVDGESDKVIGFIDQVRGEYEDQLERILLNADPCAEAVSIAICFILWRTKGIFSYDPDSPATTKNKMLSPLYINLAALYADPRAMKIVSAHMSDMISKFGATAIAGSAVRGIPFATMMAADLSLPFAIVRDKPKVHGTGKSVDGGIKKGDLVISVDELMNDGSTKEESIEKIRATGAKVLSVGVVFDRMQGGRENVRKSCGVEVKSLTDIFTFLRVGLEAGYISSDVFDACMEYLDNPEEWNKNKLKEMSVSIEAKQ